MATSGSYNYTLDRNSLIALSFKLINVYAIGATVSANDYSFASDLLNLMLKGWQPAIKIWKRRVAYLFPALSDHDYSISTTGWHVTNSYISTTISAAEASGQTVLSLTSTTGMTALDNIGIELDGGSRQWTTIVSVDSATQVTITTALTGAAAATNTVITYTSKINRPLRILQATTIDLDSSDSEVMMKSISYDEYRNYPVKSNDGRPTVYYYDRVLDSGVLYIYPETSKVNYIISFTYHDAIQDMDASTDNFDVPAEYLETIVYNLAVRLAFTYGKFLELEKLQPMADMLKMNSEYYDSDDESLKFIWGK